MQAVIDVLLIVVFGFLVFRGWWRGFVKSVFSLGRLILSFLITILLGPSFAGWIDKTFVNPPVYESVFKKFSEIASDVTATAEGGVNALIEKVPTSFRGYLDLESVDVSADVHALAEEWSHTVADGISGVIASVIGYILLFVLAFILLTVAIFIIGKCIDLIPFVRTADKLLGLAVGVVNGVLAVMLLSSVLGAILGVLGQDGIVENSLMLRLFAGVRDLFFAP